MCRPTDFLPRATPTGRQPFGLASLIGKIDCANASLCHAAGGVITSRPYTTTMQSVRTSSAGPVTRRRSLKRTQGTITPCSDDANQAMEMVSHGCFDVAEARAEDHHEKVPSSTTKRSRRRRQCSSGGSRSHHHDRSYVQHSYHDHALDVPDETGNIPGQLKEKRGSNTNLPFPMVLHNILDDAESEGYSDAISWQPHGRAFLVHNQDKFVSEVMPRFFRQTRFSSFQRQLSLYGFLRLTRKGPDSGAYYNEYFLRGKPFLCRRMSRTRIKGYWVRQSSSPETEPDFYLLPPLDGGESSPDAVGSYTTTAMQRCNPPGITNVETEERAGEAEADVDYDPLPLTAAFPAPWTVPMDCQLVTAALEATETRQQQHHHHHYSRPLPPMPPLSSYRQDILDCSGSPSKYREDPKDMLNLLSAAKIPAPPPLPVAPMAPGDTGISPEDQEALAEFLSDVDLNSEDNDDDAYHGEQQMESIYVHAARI